jgi:hypothetical protein
VDICGEGILPGKRGHCMEKFVVADLTAVIVA